MKNAQAMREELARCFEDCKNKEMSTTTLKALTSAASVMVNVTRAQIDYNKQTNNNRKIDFLEV